MNKLKKLIIAALLFLAPAVMAANFSLEWDHDALATEQISFIVEKKDVVPGTWTTVATALPGVKIADLNNVPAGTYTYRVIAVSPEGLKSEPSNELIVKVPNSAKNLRFKIK